MRRTIVMAEDAGEWGTVMSESSEQATRSTLSTFVTGRQRPRRDSNLMLGHASCLKRVFMAVILTRCVPFASPISRTCVQIDPCESLVYIMDLQSVHVPSQPIPFSLSVQGMIHSVQYILSLSISSCNASKRETKRDATLVDTQILPTQHNSTHISMLLPAMLGGSYQLWMEIECFQKLVDCPSDSQVSHSLQATPFNFSVSDLSQSSSNTRDQMPQSKREPASEMAKRIIHELKTIPQEQLGGVLNLLEDLAANLREGRSNTSGLPEHDAGENWIIEPDRWLEWWPSTYRDIGRNLLLLNKPENSGDLGKVFGNAQNPARSRWKEGDQIPRPEPPASTQKKKKGRQPGVVPFEFPAYVINLAHRTQRREHSEELLTNLGFSNIKFPNATLKDDVQEYHRMIDDSLPPWQRIGVHIWNEFESWGVSDMTALAYMARAIDQHACIADALAGGYPYFAIFEDDLLPVSSFADTNGRIHEAIAALPAWADILFLEMCFEECAEIKYHPGNPHMFESARPQCAAGMLFTAAGAQRALELTSPVWSSLDTMCVS